jgi:hypothetical protein
MKNSKLPEAFYKYDFEGFINKYLAEFDIVYNDAWCGYSDANGLLVLYHRATKKYYEQTFNSGPYGPCYDWDPQEVTLEEALQSVEDMERQIHTSF